MNKSEIIGFIKKTLISQYGENLMSSESPDSVEWNFDGGLHMCSLVFVGNKYELKIDRASICGNIDSFDKSWLLERSQKIASTGSFSFLEPYLNGQNLGEVWKTKGGVKLRLEFDSEEETINWSMRTKSGERIISINGKIVE